MMYNFLSENNKINKTWRKICLYVSYIDVVHLGKMNN